MGSWDVNGATTVYSFMDFWSSSPIPTVTITNVATNFALDGVTVVVSPPGTYGIPSGCSIQFAYMLLKIGLIEDTSAVANSLSVVSTIRDSTSGTSCINMPLGSWVVSASAVRGGDIVMGSGNLSTVISTTANTLLTFSGNFTATGNNLILRDVQSGIRVYYSV